MRFLIPLLLVLLGLSLALRIDFLVTIVWFLLAAYILTRLWGRYAASHVRVERSLIDHAFGGEDIPVDLRVVNTGRVPIPWITVDESLPVELREAPFGARAFTLPVRGQRTFRYTLVTRRRGYFTLGPARLQVGDILGIDRYELVVPRPQPFVVYPRILPLERLGLPTRSALVALPDRTPLFEDPSRIMGVREYRPGDSPRRIHWAASARSSQLLVKQYQPAIARETLLCLDLFSNDYPFQGWYDAVEQAIVVAASLASHSIVREGLSAGLATVGRDATSGETERVIVPPGSHLIPLLEVLARVNATTGEGFAELLREQGGRLRWGSTIVLIAGDVRADMAETMLYLKQRGHAVAAIVVRPDLPEATRSVAAYGVPVYRVWDDRDLAGV
jgi:uncharacterized protein (DUF58 family)